MADLDTTQNFAPGDTVTDVKLNNIIDNATVLPAFISAKTAVTPSVDPANDYLILFDASAGALRKVAPGSVPGVASIEVVSHIPATNVTPAGPQAGPVVHLDINQVNVLGNTFLAGAPGGAPGFPPFYRKIVPKDISLNVNTIPASVIDWSISNTHFKSIGANTTFSFSNASDGQSVTVELAQGATWTVHWSPSIWWEGGVEPVFSAFAGFIDIFQFWFNLGGTIGKRIVTGARP